MRFEVRNGTKGGIFWQTGKLIKLPDANLHIFMLSLTINYTFVNI